MAASSRSSTWCWCRTTGVRCRVSRGSMMMMMMMMMMMLMMITGEYGRISPNTGVTRFSLSLDTQGLITSARCSLLYHKDHLAGLECHEPLNYGV